MRRALASRGMLLLVLLLVRSAAWLALSAVIALTMLPIEFRPISDLPVGLERIGAFAALGILFGFAYPRHRLPVLIGVVIFAGLLEAAQNLTGTRHGRLLDFAIKASGVALGGMVAALPGWLKAKGVLG